MIGAAPGDLPWTISMDIEVMSGPSPLVVLELLQTLRPTAMSTATASKTRHVEGGDGYGEEKSNVRRLSMLMPLTPSRYTLPPMAPMLPS
jgi:hypothetical protein